MKEFKTEASFDRQIIDPDRTSIGWLCTYTPEEVIYAAGFHPFRLLEGTPTTKLADAYLHYNLCPYVRSCLDFGLRKENPTLKGIVIVNSCDAGAKMISCASRVYDCEYFLIDIPQEKNEEAVDYVALQLEEMAQKLITNLAQGPIDSYLEILLELRL